MSKPPKVVTLQVHFDGAIEPDGTTIAFENTIDSALDFQSMEVAAFRDDSRAYDVGLYSFYLEERGKGQYIKFQLSDMRGATGHSYRLEVTMHFLDH